MTTSCDFSETEKGIYTCSRCGKVLRLPGSVSKIRRQCSVEVAGLGDVVAKVLRKVGIKSKKGCGCDKRRKKLNGLVPNVWSRRDEP